MNQNYIFVGSGILGTAIILISLSSLSISPEMSLEQIIKNKDCKALEKWGDNNKFNENLNLSSKQLEEAMKLEFECEAKALKNIFGEK